MLLLLFVIHVLSQKSSLSQGHTLDSRAPIDSCDDIKSCRQLFDIVWGCLTTIFACTWVSVHPNVPPPDHGWLALLWRRLKLMLIAVVAPELIVGFAARQFWAARIFSKEFNVSITHGFFISMGGFVSQNGHPIVTIKQLENSEYLSAIKKVKVANIMNRSKGDALSKGVALLQGVWFITQCIARVHQHLPVTQLEVATLAFAVVNVLIWALWWGKPLDVGEPILVGASNEQAFPHGPAEQLAEAEPTISPLHSEDRFWAVINGDYTPYLPISSTSVPTYWSMDLDETDHAEDDIPFLIECLVGTIFSAIHCAAWNADFPSTIEMWMWRSCSLMVAAIPVVLGLVVLLPGTAILTIITAVSIPLYPIARLFLITIPFTSLRALPPGAFIDVDWSMYIPHL
ncbi:hypothetical protein C8R44DRAFT_895789 [Mycena epipterygia]|nr:hypothetical protein C8R44DRAFT_895789 [Mycena epipterygia]